MFGLNRFAALTEQISGNVYLTLHPERCLNTRFRALGCSLCADACPAEGAITVTNGKPALDNNACLHCGLCLHRCPTEAFTRPDSLPANVVKTVAALPAGPVDLLCPQHPHPERGPGTQAVQTQRCLAALSPATLLELSTLKKEIWLDDTSCAGCPFGQIQPAMRQTINKANSWAGLLPESVSIRWRTGDTPEPHPVVQRPVYNAATPPVSRRGLFDAFKQSGQEIVAAEEKVAWVKSGKLVPVSERLPHFVPHQRAKILSILKEHPILNNHLPISNLHVDPTRCTACALCARFCPTGALKFLSDEASFALTFQPSLCLGPDCHICIRACPEQAVSTQPVTASSNLFVKKPLVTGDLTPCQRCQQPITQGPNLPNTCFVCRPKTTGPEHGNRVYLPSPESVEAQ